ncbi:hypothetical protein CYMTET_36534, partial [Cymbomonas tetramitiformis]
ETAFRLVERPGACEYRMMAALGIGCRSWTTLAVSILALAVCFGPLRPAFYYVTHRPLSSKPTNVQANLLLTQRRQALKIARVNYTAMRIAAVSEKKPNRVACGEGGNDCGDRGQCVCAI